jgi:hypothetical protein
MKRVWLHSTLTLSALLSINCGPYHYATCTVSARVDPTDAQADHGAAMPADKVRFSVVALPKGNCPLLVGHVGSWSTSDPANTAISNEPPTQGVATCLSATPSPARITNDGRVLGHSIAGATLTCI